MSSHLYRVNIKCPADRPALPPYCFGLRSRVPAADAADKHCVVIVCEPVHSKNELAFLSSHGIQAAQ